MSYQKNVTNFNQQVVLQQHWLLDLRWPWPSPTHSIYKSIIFPCLIEITKAQTQYGCYDCRWLNYKNSYVNFFFRSHLCCCCSECAWYSRTRRCTCKNAFFSNPVNQYQVHIDFKIMKKHLLLFFLGKSFVCLFLFTGYQRSWRSIRLFWSQRSWWTPCTYTNFSNSYLKFKYKNIQPTIQDL